MKEMRLIYLCFCAVLLVSAACKNSLKRKGGNRFQNSVITLEKTECYGTCPVYFIIVKGTGEVLYEGKEHVSRKGKYKKQLTDKEVSRLFNKFECASFFDFQSEYTDNVSDLPTTLISFEHKGFKKTIKDYYGAPEELKQLERMVEEIAESEEGWEKTNFEF